MTLCGSLSRAALERGVTEKAVVRPLSKTDLRHEFWFQPVKLIHFFDGDAFAEMAAVGQEIGKWTFTR